MTTSASSASQERSRISKMTTKGQVTVPKHIRQHLDLAPGSRIEFFIGLDGKVTIVPVTADVKKLEGILPKLEKAATLEQMQEAIVKGAKSGL